MARASRRRSVAVKRRGRDKKGRFLKKTAARRQLNPVKKKKSKAKRAKKVCRKHKVSGYTTKTGKRVAARYRKSKRCQHKVRGYTTKTGRAVAAHYSREEGSTMKRKPRRRRARRAREAVYESAAMENPTKKKRKKGKRKAPRKAKRSSKRRAAPRRRIRRVAVPVITRRKKGRRASAGIKIVRIQLVSKKSARKSSKRRSAPRKKRKSSKRRSHRRMSAPTYRMLPQHAGPSGMFENPFGGNAFENPLSGGELALAFVTGGIGFAATDMLGRYVAVMKAQPNDIVGANTLILGPPSIAQVLAKSGAVALPFLAAYFVKQPMGRAALQGFGLGAGANLVGQLFKSFVLARFLKDKDIGKRLYGNEISANMALAPAPSGATAGPPMLGVGRPVFLEAPRMGSVGDLKSMSFPNDMTPSYSAVPSGSAPVLSNGGPSCGPCGAETAAAAIQSAYAAAQDAANGCGGMAGVPAGVAAPPSFALKPYQAFPDN